MYSWSRSSVRGTRFSQKLMCKHVGESIHLHKYLSFNGSEAFNRKVKGGDTEDPVEDPYHPELNEKQHGFVQCVN